MKFLPHARVLVCVLVAALLGPRATAKPSLKWNYTTNNRVVSSPALGADGTLYVGSQDNNIYAIDSTGRLKWKFSTNDWVPSSPVLGADGTLYVGSHNNNIYAIDSTGSLKWKFPTNREVWSSPVLGADGTLYVGSSTGYGSVDNNIYAIDTGFPCNCPAGTFLNSSASFTSCSQLATLCSACPRGSNCPYRRSA
jgi:glucose dehydrogenase